MEDQLVLLDGRFELGTQFYSGNGPVLETVFEYLVGVLTPAFGGIHRQVGMPHQLLRSKTGLHEGDPHAGVTGHLLAHDRERLSEDSDDPLHHFDGVLRGGEMFEQNGELVATQTGDSVVWSAARLEPLAHRHQELVSGRVAERIVHRLEVVEVEEQYRRRCTLCRGFVGDLSESLPQQRPVGQSCEGVMCGPMPQILLEMGELDQRVLQPSVLQGHAHLAGEGLEESEVTGCERSHVTQGVDNDHHAVGALRSLDWSHHLVICVPPQCPTVTGLSV